MILKNARLWNNDRFVCRDICIDDNGLITENSCGEIVDLKGMKAVPGLVDTHIHGCFGYDVSDLSSDSIVQMALMLPRFGVTSFCPTTMTMSEDNIFRCFDAVREACDILETCGSPYSRILGIHLEGPFLSPAKTAVQGKDHLIEPTDGSGLINELEKRFPGMLKIIDIAPEMPGGLEFIKEFNKSYVLSAAHTSCDYELGMKAFEAGLSSVTHRLNATLPIDKRAPGIVCAAMDSGAFVEIICDGIHIQPPVLRLLFRMFSADRTVIISDSMRGSGMPDGIYKLGDTDVECSNGRTFYGRGRDLAGSVTNLADEYRNLLSAGISEERIIRSMTVNPLSRIGEEGGKLSPGERADIVIMDGDRLYSVFCQGVKVL